MHLLTTLRDILTIEEQVIGAGELYLTPDKKREIATRVADRLVIHSATEGDDAMLRDEMRSQFHQMN
jgi:hypothetical protein